MLSSNSGVLALDEVETRLRVVDRLALCIDDPRCPYQVAHSLADMVGILIEDDCRRFMPIDCVPIRSSRWPEDGLPSGRLVAV
ncbi:transposase [Mesorhizobium sp. M0028]|uniref:hypothetical protein n=1 Tax=Mesorhizobium sp. M0028 TaxID=2956849 RepID=UPI0033368E47